MKYRSLSQLFLKTVDSNPNFNILSYKDGKIWKSINRYEMYQMTNSCIDKLKYYNVKKEDRVAFKGKNAKENLAWNLATNSLGAVWVPMYPDQSTEYCNYIVNDCQPKLLISADENDKNNIKNTLIIDRDIEVDTKSCNENLNFVNNELSTLIYTSGTTGNPKGVMLTNENILSNIDTISSRYRDIKNIRSLNILPWAHIYSLTCELYYNLLNDNHTYISTSKENFIKECYEVSPEVLYLVPKVLETIKNKIEIFDKPLIRYILPVLMKRIFGKNLITIFMGGAKLDPLTRKFYLDNNINICEGYGCSETSPMVSVNHMLEPRDVESVGKVMDNVIVEIIDNEICVSGPNVMKGYWNQPESTDSVLFEKDNKIWYKTGDTGFLSDNYLYYSGRKSDNYKLNNGKFVNVLDVENKIKPYLSGNFIIYGENLSKNVLISDKNIDTKTLDSINSGLNNYLKIEKSYLIDEKTMNAFMTPKMSIKRKALIKYFIDNFDI